MTLVETYITMALVGYFKNVIICNVYKLQNHGNIAILTNQIPQELFSNQFEGTDYLNTRKFWKFNKLYGNNNEGQKCKIH